MKHTQLPDGHILEARSEPVEITRGRHGVPLEPTRRFAPGPVSWFLDGEPISTEEAQRLLAEHGEESQSSGTSGSG